MADHMFTIHREVVGEAALVRFACPDCDARGWFRIVPASSADGTVAILEAVHRRNRQW